MFETDSDDEKSGGGPASGTRSSSSSDASNRDRSEEAYSRFLQEQFDLARTAHQIDSLSDRIECLADFEAFCRAHVLWPDGSLPQMFQLRSWKYPAHPLDHLDENGTLHLRSPHSLFSKEHSGPAFVENPVNSLVLVRILNAYGVFSSTPLYFVVLEDLRFGIFCGPDCYYEGKLTTKLEGLKWIRKFFTCHLCPGIESSLYDLSQVGLIKSQITHYGLHRHVDCPIMVESPHPRRECCDKCTQLKVNWRTAKRKVELRPERLEQMTDADSSTPFNALTDEMKTKRLKSMSIKVKDMHRRVRDLFRMNQSLLLEQSEIDDDSSLNIAKMLEYAAKPSQQSVLDDLLRDAPDEETADSLRAHFTQQFQIAQRYLRGESMHGARWNVATYRLAIAVYLKSHAAYETLQRSGMIFLPSVRSLQEKITASTRPGGGTPTEGYPTVFDISYQ